MDLALNNLQWLICHKTKPKQIKLEIDWGSKSYSQLEYTGSVSCIKQGEWVSPLSKLPHNKLNSVVCRGAQD